MSVPRGDYPDEMYVEASEQLKAAALAERERIDGLRLCGYPVPFTGDFGPVTHGCVERYGHVGEHR